MVPQARTEAILRDRLCSLGGEVEFGKALTAFTQNGEGINATLSTGEVVKAVFLVGAMAAQRGAKNTWPALAGRNNR